MTTPTIPAVHREITVRAPAQRAFEVFTGSMAGWWPKGYHIGAVEPAEIVLGGPAAHARAGRSA